MLSEVRARSGQTDRQTDTMTHTRTHAHTERDRDATERMTTAGW